MNPNRWSVSHLFIHSCGIPNEDNDLLMAIFKQCSEGDDSIEEHWFQEEDEDLPNVQFEIWRVLASYAGVVRDPNPFLPNGLCHPY